MGWGDELDKIPSGVTKPQDDPVVVKACQKELTDRSESQVLSAIPAAYSLCSTA